MRTEIPVDVDLLKKVIGEVEASNTFATRTELWTALSDAYNQQTQGVKVNPQLVSLRVKKLNLELKTGLGRRGRQKGEKVVVTTRRSRESKFLSNPKISKSFDALERYLRRDKVYNRFKSTFERMKKGSITAAIKMHCLECSNWQPVEVKNCQCGGSCPLHHIRPYQSGQDVELVQLGAAIAEEIKDIEDEDQEGNGG